MIQEPTTDQAIADQEPIHASISRYMTLWTVFDGVVVKDGRNRVYFYQPLDTDAPESAKPQCYLQNKVDFYTREGKDGCRSRTWRTAQHYQFNDMNPHLLSVKGVWYEGGGGEILWFRGRWHCRHVLWRNTQLAQMMNKAAGLGRLYTRGEVAEVLKTLKDLVDLAEKDPAEARLLIESAMKRIPQEEKVPA